jgi:riboflavin synthase
MFTGLIENVGKIRKLTKNREVLTVTIETGIKLIEISIGESISCNGVCLTVIKKDDKNSLISLQAVKETLSQTTLSEWNTGREINLERALAIGDRLDGHFVSGHVDGVGKVVRITPLGEQTTITINLPSQIMKYMVHKGSITIDGISLTISKINGSNLDVAVIPFTKKHTNLNKLRPGVKVNIEGDLIGKYIQKFMKP